MRAAAVLCSLLCCAATAHPDADACAAPGGDCQETEEAALLQRAAERRDLVLQTPPPTSGDGAFRRVTEALQRRRGAVTSGSGISCYQNGTDGSAATMGSCEESDDKCSVTTVGGSKVYTCGNTHACDLANMAGDFMDHIFGEGNNPLAGHLDLSCCEGDGCNVPGAAALAQQLAPRDRRGAFRRVTEALQRRRGAVASGSGISCYQNGTDGSAATMGSCEESDDKCSVTTVGGSKVYTCGNTHACDLANMAGDFMDHIFGEGNNPLAGHVDLSCCEGDGCNVPGAAALAQQPAPLDRHGAFRREAV